MKNSWKKRLSIVLALVVAITSFSFVGAFAEPEPEPEPLGKVTGLQAHSGYKKVHLNWDSVAGATGYAVAVGNGNPVNVGNVNSYAVGKLAEGKSYTFHVYAIRGDDKSEPATVSKATARPMYYKLTVKGGATLKSHAGKRAKYRIKKGQKILATHFSSGKFVFNHNNSTFYVKTTRVKVKAQYNKGKKRKDDYSDAEAQYVVNDRGISSPTGQLLWVSTYTQRVYYFTGSKGKWVLRRSWPCSTGKPKSPTPTGLSRLKKIGRKIRSRHGYPYWSTFSSLNSFHDVGGNKKILGSLASSGCVRNARADAKFIYKSVRKRTPVFIF